MVLFTFQMKLNFQIEIWKPIYYQNIYWEDKNFELPFDWFSTILRYLSNLELISLQFENIG